MSRNRVNAKTLGIARFMGREDRRRWTQAVADPPHNGGDTIRLEDAAMKEPRKEIDYGEIFNF